MSDESPVRPGAPRPTLEQVAARAGVGRGTASRVINGSPSVSARTREAVMQAVDELGYVPNQAARSLVTRRTGAIALVIAEPEERLFSEPFFAGVVRGISEAADEAGRQLVLVLARGSGRTAEPATYLSPQHVDGVLLLSQHAGDPLPGVLRERGLELVLGGRPADPDGLPYVDVDNTGGARTAVEHLLQRGRRRIVTVAGPQDMTAAEDRLAGYRTTLADAGLQVHDSDVAEGDFTEQGGLVATRRLLEQVPDLDAVFAASDPMAVGAIRALREAGRRVPQDVAVIGFDDSTMAAMTDPPLTTIAQPVDRIGHELVAMLLSRIAPGDATPAPMVELPTTLVIREST
ncbi:DNA-binding LacI/PurR family transcriptional regulator [Mumia flava]|uniref:DNA-binding LacI/PurR family transcriptional regulator n=1 Tax=Mumia flava TaxID=1348852 RepID=A0A0B2B2F4_9ACTN|nr:LacI family DNA-binding transcriptional regulator [Mumia flava]PJJ57890.1 DNA-binding LacI/PurR family transcriptional regulator [Mumia flava]